MSKDSPSRSTSGGSSATNNDYTVTSSGTNEAGNHYCHRDFGPDAANQNSYHYSNTDGSYYYSNSNGSTYYNDGQGGARYTAPGGKR